MYYSPVTRIVKFTSHSQRFYKAWYLLSYCRPLCPKFNICFCCFTNNFKAKISLKHEVLIRSLSKKRNPLHKFLYNTNDIIITTCFLSTRIKLVDTPSFFLFSARIYKYASLERCASHVCIHIFRLYGSIKQLTIII